MSETLLSELINTIVTLIVIPFIVVPLFKALKAKVNNDNLVKYFNILEDAVSTSVKAVAQTYVDALKKEGSFDQESKEEAFIMAKTKVLSTVGDSAIKAIKEIKGEKWEEYLEDKIEAAIKK
jgi:hypothetical protein